MQAGREQKPARQTILQWLCPGAEVFRKYSIAGVQDCKVQNKWTHIDTHGPRTLPMCPLSVVPAGNGETQFCSSSQMAVPGYTITCQILTAPDDLSEHIATVTRIVLYKASLLSQCRAHACCIQVCLTSPVNALQISAVFKSNLDMSVRNYGLFTVKPAGFFPPPLTPKTHQHTHAASVLLRAPLHFTNSEDLICPFLVLLMQHVLRYVQANKTLSCQHALKHILSPPCMNKVWLHHI